MKRILVTGAGGAASSNFVDSLRYSGDPYFVVGIDRSPYQLELANVDARYLVPPPTNPDYVPALNRVIEREHLEFVHAQPDPEVRAISRDRARLRAATYLPSHEVITMCEDKMAVAGRLSERDVPVGASAEISDAEDLRSAFNRLRARHAKVWIRARTGAGARASLAVTHLAEAEAWISYWSENRGLSLRDFMLVEFLPGKEFAFQSIWHDGRLVTSQARQRVEYLFGHLTPSGQTSSPSVAVTVHRNDVNDVAQRAVRAVDPNPSGVFCVDLKENEAGMPCVTEINAGRFFTTSNFLARAGSNMPHYYLKLGYGEPVPDVPAVNAVAAGLYWVRMIDMGYRLVRDGEWSSARA